MVWAFSKRARQFYATQKFMYLNACLQIITYAHYSRLAWNSTVLERSTVCPFCHCTSTNSSSVICTCIKLWWLSGRAYAIINQSILFFVGSNPDASTYIYFSVQNPHTDGMLLTVKRCLCISLARRFFAPNSNQPIKKSNSIRSKNTHFYPCRLHFPLVNVK